MNTITSTPVQWRLNRVPIIRRARLCYGTACTDAEPDPAFDVALESRRNVHRSCTVDILRTVALGPWRFNGDALRGLRVLWIAPERFRRWLTLGLRCNTRPAFNATDVIRRPQQAIGIAFNLNRGCFGPDDGFDALESEALDVCH